MRQPPHPAPLVPVVASADSGLDQRLSDELDRHNAAATPGVAPAEELTVRIEDGGDLLAEAFEAEARRRGCTHVFVTSFTFQAPELYRRRGYRELFRWASVPTPGCDDVHLRKEL